LPGTGFDLDDDGNSGNAYSNSQTFTLTAGSYTVTEAAVTGWTVGPINCTQSGAMNSSVSGNVPGVTVNLGIGGNVTCTFTNTRQTATLTITKVAVPQDPQDFQFTMTRIGSAGQLDPGR